MDVAAKALELLGKQGVRVEHVRLDGYNGLYIPTHQTVLINNQLDPFTEAACLCHELGHVLRHDTGHAAPYVEHRADMTGALAVITPAMYEQVEHEYGATVAALAYGLGVTPTLVTAWRDAYRSAGGTI